MGARFNSNIGRENEIAQLRSMIHRPIWDMTILIVHVHEICISPSCPIDRHEPCQVSYRVPFRKHDENTSKSGFPHVSVKLLANVCLWMTRVAPSRAMAFRLTHVFSPSTFSRTPAQNTKQQAASNKQQRKSGRYDQPHALRLVAQHDVIHHYSVDDFDSLRHYVPFFCAWEASVGGGRGVPRRWLY